MSRQLSSLIRDRGGSAAAEMALSLPLLLTLLFGTFELGYYFMSEHVVQKSVRDAARFGARLAMTNYPSCTVPANGTAEQQIRRVARFGNAAGSGTPRLLGWTADNMTTVTIACDNSSSYGTGGIYEEFPNGAPVVTVTAVVPYNTFFGVLSLGSASLNLNSHSQAAVIGA
jgi:Flp pilus assembly protein TadG